MKATEFLKHSRLLRFTAIIIFGLGISLAEILTPVLGYPVAAIGVALFALDIVIN